MARTACLVCFISTVNGHCNKKRKEETYPWKAGASSRHTTNLKQSILRLSISMDTMKAHLRYQKSALIWGEDSKIYPIYFLQISQYCCQAKKWGQGGGGIIGTFKFTEFFDESNSIDECCWSCFRSTRARSPISWPEWPGDKILELLFFAADAIKIKIQRLALSSFYGSV